jgi:3-hydroxyacyl-[acyl-carrier-protein] dehydratase
LSNPNFAVTRNTFPASGIAKFRPFFRALFEGFVKFILVDQVLAHEPGKRLVMAKNVTMAEEYLADHFPGFPVLPGVMMLEAAVQTAAWLVRLHLNFAHSLIVLKEARGVRYGAFVAPGQTLSVTAEAVEIGAKRSDFKIRGVISGATAIQARLELAHLNLADTDPAMARTDALAIAAQRERWQTILQHRQAPALAG